MQIQINKCSKRSSVLKAVKNHGLELLNADKKYLGDKQIVLEALKNRYTMYTKQNYLREWADEEDGKNTYIFNHVNKGLFKDIDICVAFIKAYYWDFFDKSLIHKSVLNNKKFYLKLFKELKVNDYDIEESPDIRHGIYNIASSAIKQDLSISLKYLDTVSNTSPIAFHKSLFRNNKFVSKMLSKIDVNDLQMIDKKLFKSKNICKAILDKTINKNFDYYNVLYIDKNLFNDKDILKAVLNIFILDTVFVKKSIKSNDQIRSRIVSKIMPVALEKLDLIKKDPIYQLELIVEKTVRFMTEYRNKNIYGSIKHL